MKQWVHFFSLFGSIGTLFCCALPVILVSLGMGATFASLTSLFPQIHWITGYKNWLFLITGVLLLVSYFLVRTSKVMECPIDDKQQPSCLRAKTTSRWIFGCAVFCYSVGWVFAYILPIVFV